MKVAVSLKNINQYVPHMMIGESFTLYLTDYLLLPLACIKGWHARLIEIVFLLF